MSNGKKEKKNKHIKMGSVPWAPAFKENKESRFGDISVTLLKRRKNNQAGLPLQAGFLISLLL